MSWSNSDLVRLAVLARKKECAWRRQPYVKPAAVVEFRRGGSLWFRFLTSKNTTLWEVSKSYLVQATDGGNYYFTEDFTHWISGEELTREFYRACLIAV
jgi:hypothetical protein